jgi:hypothetical protein
VCFTSFMNCCGCLFCFIIGGVRSKFSVCCMKEGASIYYWVRFILCAFLFTVYVFVCGLLPCFSCILYSVHLLLHFSYYCVLLLRASLPSHRDDLDLFR